MENTLTRSRSATQSFNVTEQQQIAVGLGGLDQIFGLALDLTWSRTEDRGWAKTTSETDTHALTVPVGFKGWWEWSPKLVRTDGWMEAQYDTEIFGKKTWEYPEKGSLDLTVYTPVVTKTPGLPPKAVGTWYSKIVACDTFSITSDASSKCLDIDGGTMSGQVQIYTCIGGVNQKWIHKDSGQIASAAGGQGGACLAYGGADNQKLTMDKCIQDPTTIPDETEKNYAIRQIQASQKWDIIPETKQIRPATLFVGNTHCLDVFGGFTADRTPVIKYPCRPYASNQQWTIVR